MTFKRWEYIKYNVRSLPYTLRQDFLHWFWKKIPNSWLYWAVIQAWANSTVEHYTHKTPDEVNWIMACDYLGGKYKEQMAEKLRLPRKKKK